MKDRAVLLRYHEIALKGDNRGWFEERLAVNARKALGPGVSFEREHGRILLDAEWNEITQQSLKRVFGLTNFSPIRIVPTDKPTLIRAAIEEARSHFDRHGMPQTFRMTTRRSDKALPETSTELDKLFGSSMVEAFPSLKVDLKNPQFILGIEIRFENSYVWTEKIEAHGGLPVGTNAKVLSLLSGGLDSPVAAIQVMRRGSPTGLIHFYGAPFVGEDVLAKIEDLARIVNRYQPDPQPVHVVPFGKIQEKIALATSPKMRTVLYRRMMIRIANEIARRTGALALVTGESLGQVASQTVENLSTIDRVSEIPILRPLVTYDKAEIIERAKAWGTYETSIRPAVDCCTLFADRHPALRTTSETAEEQERKFPVEEFVKEAAGQVLLKNL